jgi:hypothetical protein
VDVAAEHVLALLWQGESYEQLDAFVESDGDSMSMSLEVPDSHSRLSAFGNKLPLIDDRVFATWYAWERDKSGAIVIAFTQYTGMHQPTPLPLFPIRNSTKQLTLVPHADFPDANYRNMIDDAITDHESASKAVKGSLIGFWRLSRLAPNVCRVTFVAQGSMGGRVPDAAMKFATKKTLAIVDRVRDRHERSGTAVDAELRGAFPPPPTLGQLNEEQKRIAQSCMALETGSAAVEWTKLKSASPFVELGMKYSKPIGKHEARYAPPDPRASDPPPPPPC